ncbi:hypothetical protein [Synechococcus sp. UW179A]|uniref:hypothetical protein n=1 Tax=Synechococcus sp. UW179A TaxID=2575510 RepID=UPI001482B092|nr:hypothetical protein [Synechococcus sp. UW179A]
MAAGDHCLVHVHSVHEQLSYSPAVAIGGDAAKAFRLSSLTIQFDGVDASQPDLLTASGPAGFTVVAVADGDGFEDRNGLRQAHH